MVATPSPTVARWAGQPIDVGNGTVFRQHIIGPQTIPKVTEASRAAREPELAVLSVLARARRNTPTARQIATAVITGLSKLRNGKKRLLYLLSVQKALSAALRKALEMTPDPDLRKFLTASQQRAYDKAEAKGMAKGRAEDVVKILIKRGLPVTPRQRRQIEECTDLATLDRWFDRMLTAASVDELLGEPRCNGHRTARRA